MPDLSPADHAVIATLADFTAAVYLPEYGKAVTCPRWRVPLHHCPADYTLPQAVAAAGRLSVGGVDAVVIVYGVPCDTEALRRLLTARQTRSGTGRP